MRTDQGIIMHWTFQLSREVFAGNLNHFRGVFILLIASMLTLGVVHAQEDETDDEEEVEATELEDAPVIPATPIEEVVVTGSRLQQYPGDQASQTIVLDEDTIRSMGEITLERILRQLPQNANATSERFGSNLNQASNLTGASTVNLRGLGSESTLILVDGKRIGYNGILGGVTDVSSIPLSMVERIEVVLDGASAIYGSDAVGGVVNVILRKDYEGVELTLNYDRPDAAGYSESRVAINTSQVLGNVQVRAGYQRADHTGLDASDREVTLFQQSIFSGPQYDVRFCCSAQGEAFPILYRLNGAILTFPEWRALSDEDKASAQAIRYAVLPEGFNENSSVTEITQFGLPNWGAETQAGFSVLPETTRNSYNLGISTDITDSITLDAQVRGEMRNTINRRGYVSLSGETLTGRSPFNPFGRSVHLRGQRRDMPQPYTETDAQNTDLSFDLVGDLNERWSWEVSVGRSREDADSSQFFNMDRTSLRAGMNSDGVTPIRSFLSGLTPDECTERGGSFFFGLCQVSMDPPPAINPFGDLSAYLEDELMSMSLNTQSRMSGLLKGEVLEMPGGPVRFLVGASNESTGLETSAEFQVATLGTPLGDITNFHTDASRSNWAMFFEGAVPLISSKNARAGAAGLNLTFSARRDSYGNPDVTYFEDGVGKDAENLPDPGAENTWGVGLVYAPVDSVRFKMSRQTAFVAPQLNQLLRQTAEGPSAPFRGIFLEQPDGSLVSTPVIVREGGNPDLQAETGNTQSYGIEFFPAALPAFGLKMTYSDVSYENRISRLSNFIVDPNDLPSDTIYDAATDTYFQERRWINVSSIERDGIDYELLWNATLDRGEFDLSYTLSTVRNYDYVLDPAVEEDSISIVGTTMGTTAIPVVPEKGSSVIARYFYRGVEAALAISSQSRTQIISTSGVERTYLPPRLTNLTLSYHMQSDSVWGAPGFLENSRVTLVISNLSDEFGESMVRGSDGSVLPQTSPDSSPLYGRAFSLSLHTMF